MQPESGGFLESTPITAFVVMSLASIGLGQHRIVRRGVEFLLASVRSDASWPIVLNLATWNTTLAMNALVKKAPSLHGEPLSAASHETVASSTPWMDTTNDSHPLLESLDGKLSSADADALDENCLDWLLDGQASEPDSYNGAEPGGWAWTDSPGGVPEAVDTANALLSAGTLAPSISASEISPPRARCAAGCRVAARTAEPRRRLAHVLSRLEPAHVRSQRMRRHGAGDSCSGCVGRSLACRRTQGEFVH